MGPDSRRFRPRLDAGAPVRGRGWIAVRSARVEAVNDSVLLRWAEVLSFAALVSRLPHAVEVEVLEQRLLLTVRADIRRRNRQGSGDRVRRQRANMGARVVE